VVRFGVASAVAFVLAIGAGPAAGNHSPFLGPQIYSIRIDGGGRTNLSEGRGWDDRLARAPNGRTLAFVRWVPGLDLSEGVEGLWTMRADGTGERLLLVNDAARCSQCLSRPAWSPDGTRLAVLRSGPSAGLWVIDVRTRAARRLSSVATPDFEDPPSWSPDGRAIAFASADASTCGIGQYTNCARWSVAVVRSDGTGFRLVATKAANPRWSPSGRWIAYRIRDGGESLGLGVVQPDGRGNHRVYPSRLRIGAVGAFRWSPFGQLLFKGPSGLILGALPDRRGVVRTRLVGLPLEGFFEWSPSRARVAAIWSPNSRTRPQVWLQNADGGARRRVTNEQHVSEIPGGPFLRDVAWSRDGRRLFYAY
jgi:Tol biopolymer transport system component